MIFSILLPICDFCRPSRRTLRLERGHSEGSHQGGPGERLLNHDGDNIDNDEEHIDDQHDDDDQHKGARQKLLSGFSLLRGGGYPPFPLRVFGQDDFSLRGEGGTPQFR